MTSTKFRNQQSMAKLNCYDSKLINPTRIPESILAFVKCGFHCMPILRVIYRKIFGRRFFRKNLIYFCLSRGDTNSARVSPLLCALFPSPRRDSSKICMGKLHFKIEQKNDKTPMLALCSASVSKNRYSILSGLASGV